MKILQVTLPLLLLITDMMCLSAQEKNSNGHFLVEFDEFSPPVQDIIKSFEGNPATAFMAKDMQGIERKLNDYLGTPTIMFFWRVDNVDAISMLYDLNLLQKKYGDKVSVIAMGEDSRSEIEAFLGESVMDIDIIPNVKMLSEAVYGSELGIPRVFVLSASGIIETIIPEEHFKKYADHNRILDQAIKGQL